ncbi:major facilitator superfamily MFS_1 [[Enterobacter] lignolyticus SCF1]|uniref:Major facilitator superfamily MFS_1 n=1 Tax=Enterobacter lignolyticus (strain SCF1) TaxID=701347 RepID=E3GBA4_ENTLS|nr:major facilitator superfamily MFS_1 [[Enterobacter] lignolyticus SCF1]
MFSNLQIICLQMVSLFISFCFFVLNSSATNDHGSIVGLSLSGFFFVLSVWPFICVILSGDKK